MSWEDGVVSFPACENCTPDIVQAFGIWDGKKFVWLTRYSLRIPCCNPSGWLLCIMDKLKCALGTLANKWPWPHSYLTPHCLLKKSEIPHWVKACRSQPCCCWVILGLLLVKNSDHQENVFDSIWPNVKVPVTFVSDSFSPIWLL